MIERPKGSGLTVAVGKVGARLRGLLLLSVAVAFAVSTDSVRAATITPTTFTDDLTNNGNCTLREAVRAANADAAVDACAAGSGADRLVLNPGRYVLSRTGRGEDLAASGDLDLSTDMEIRSSNTVDPPFGFVPEQSHTTIDAAGIDRAFDITAEVVLDSMTITDGDAIGDGGGIRVRFVVGRSPSLLIHRSKVAGNTATGEGGGISGSHTATTGTGVDVNRSTISGNHAATGGGYSLSGSLGSLNRSTVSDNASSGAGGGVALIQAGTGLADSSSISIGRSTISGNVSGANGGGIVATTTDAGGSGGALHGFLGVRRSTIADNQAAGVGGGIRIVGTAGVRRSLVETIVADNDALAAPIAPERSIPATSFTVALGTTCLGRHPGALFSTWEGLI